MTTSAGDAMGDLHPVWLPDDGVVEAANLTGFMREAGLASYADLHRWSTEERAAFWEAVTVRLGIVFSTPAEAIMGSDDVEDPGWFTGATLNIVESCFTGDGRRPAVVHRRRGRIESLSRDELRTVVARVAAGLRAMGIGPGDRVAIAMPMNLESVAAYLAIVAVGAVVVSIADSFAPDEIATRLAIADADVAVTQERTHRAGRSLPMYEKLVDAGIGAAIVVSSGDRLPLRSQDRRWEDVLGPAGSLAPALMGVSDHTNILFSSGTTGEPKAIPWTQLTPIKGAMDGHFHHDIKSGGVVAWPTNLGWMMGPWLIYASLLNGAALALYDDAPNTVGFARFVEDAGVTMLGVVPSLVAAWRDLDLAGIDWTGIEVLSSTGEASDPADMTWLMERAAAPVIEYCGGTEIGGGYVTGTVLHPAVPSTFSTPTLGLDLVLVDEHGTLTDDGEVFVVPPSIGLSTELLNRDHHEVYYAGVPDVGLPIRRHGDHMRRLPGGFYRSLGRIDDTMNLGGIKVSSAELERAIGDVPDVAEVAAVAVAPAGGGPDRLVVFAVPSSGPGDPDRWRAEMQDRLRAHLNPLFRVSDVIVVDELPRTASNKVMRRELRAMATPESPG